MVTSAGMKAEDVDKATPSTLTPGSACGEMELKYTLLVVEKPKVAKVKSYGNFELCVEFGTWR